jgi:hypothetical protein
MACGTHPFAAVCVIMLRTLVTRLLIVFTLLANLGWATDMYAGDGAADHANLTTAAGEHQGDCPPGIDCHHCCHASAHLQTIPGSGISFAFSAGQRINVAVDTHLYSFIPAPPYQPPRV